MRVQATIKKIAVIGIILLATLICKAQREHLEPARDFAQYEGLSKDYHDAVIPMLIREFSEKPYARYISMPSFSKEYAFSVEMKGNKYYVISNALLENYWYAAKKDEVTIETTQSEISKSLYLKIGELFQFLADQTKIKVVENNLDEIGFDGTTYFFSATNSKGEVKTGETWSPYKGTLLNRLVKTCDNLCSLHDEQGISIGTLENEIDKLIVELNHN
ncbi:MAG: hypothetical protein ACK5M7_04420 [Draconibacterium sp.]